jgi:hypothetical protein
MQPNENTLQEIKEVIGYYLAAKGIAANEENKQALAFDGIKQTEFYNLAHRLKENVLKQIEQKSGSGSAQYKFYFSLFESLVYLTTVLDREDFYKRELHLHKLQLQFYTARNIFLEQQLTKYIALDDLNRLETATEILKNTSNNQWQKI